MQEVKVQTAALRAVGNIVTGTDEQTQVVAYVFYANIPKKLTYNIQLVSGGWQGPLPYK